MRHYGLSPDERARSEATAPPFRLDFIVGGVQKAGTTSLFGYLSAHPQLLAPSQKETHFFDNEKLDWPASKPSCPAQVLS